MIDCAFERRLTYAMCVRYGFIAVEGAQPENGVFIHPVGKGRVVARSYSPATRGDPEMGKTEEGLRYARVIKFVKSTMNSRVAGLIDKDRIEHASDLGPEMEQTYKAQMAARVRKIEYDPKGKKPKSWWTETKNDHARDCWNQQALGATLADILMDEVPSDGEEEQAAG
jgi:hypothetical protein